MTNLANRRYFFEVADGECERADRYARALSLVLVDVDHFKQVNDRFGHDTGDAVLQQITEIIKSVACTQDLVARLVGDEFGVLLPETSSSDAAHFAERVRSAVELASTRARPSTVQVTASFGVAQRELGETGIADALRLADALLYEAKRQGRNRVSNGWTPAALQRSA